MSNRLVGLGCFLVLVLLAAGTAQAAVTIETVTVGNAGNAADTTGYGAVAYSYNIGKYEVTCGQYTEFLNAVAKTDTYGLYTDDMLLNNGTLGIIRAGSAGNYSYSVTPTTITRRPAYMVSFWDACRFANWLNNGQGGAGTTEYGAYTMTSTGIANNTITRNAGAQWAVTSEDEWYKAAYYKGGSANAGYWRYPTSGNSITADMANYNGPGGLTDVGSYADPSPYGTYDQGGNLWEWNEAIINGTYRGVRGGAYNTRDDYYLQASFRNYNVPTFDIGYGIGFRVVEVPEPATLSLLGLGLAGLIARRKRK